MENEHLEWKWIQCTEILKNKPFIDPLGDFDVNSEIIDELNLVLHKYPNYFEGAKFATYNKWIVKDSDQNNEIVVSLSSFGHFSDSFNCDSIVLPEYVYENKKKFPIVFNITSDCFIPLFFSEKFKYIEYFFKLDTIKKTNGTHFECVPLIYKPIYFK